MASAPPLNGTCTAWIPALDTKRSALKWVALPTPTDEKFKAPGRAWATATSSATELTPFAGDTTRTLAEMPTGTTAMKSRAGWKGKPL
jgi:hypothetical protein